MIVAKKRREELMIQNSRIRFMKIVDITVKLSIMWME
jgi:hypothetical protein